MPLIIIALIPAALRGTCATGRWAPRRLLRRNLLISAGRHIVRSSAIKLIDLVLVGLHLV